jgi:hypothetical protein
MRRRKDVAPIQYYNSLKSTITKGKMRHGMVVKNLPESLRKLLLFCALKKKCYVENIIETALRDYFAKDKTIAPFLDCNFEVDFSESFNIRRVENTIEVQK